MTEEARAPRTCMRGSDVSGDEDSIRSFRKGTRTDRLAVPARDGDNSACPSLMATPPVRKNPVGAEGQAVEANARRVGESISQGGG